jgi:hypothetical protein
LNNITAGVREREEANRTREAGHLDEIQGVMANTLKSLRNGAVGFIGWSDLKLDFTQHDIRVRTVWYLVLKRNDNETVNAALVLHAFRPCDNLVLLLCIKQVSDDNVRVAVAIIIPRYVDRGVMRVYGVGDEVAFVVYLEVILLAMLEANEEVYVCGAWNDDEQNNGGNKALHLGLTRKR